MAFTDVATDDFSGTLGSFTEQLSATNTMAITSGLVHASFSGTTLTDFAQTMRNTGTFSESQFSEIEVSNFASASGYFGVSVQCTGTGSSRQLYAAYIRGFNKQVTIAQRTSGGTITTLAGPTTITFADNDKLALGFDSATGKLTVYKNRVAADAALTDVAVSGTAFSGGRPGIVGGGSSSTVKGDNWVGGDLGSSGPSVAIKSQMLLKACS